jgi:hypothetical protein
LTEGLGTLATISQFKAFLLITAKDTPSNESSNAGLHGLFLPKLIMRLKIVIIALCFGFTSCKESKKKENTASKPAITYSSAFNQSVDHTLEGYYQLTEAFVNWDTASVIKSARQLFSKIDSLPVNEIQVSDQRKAGVALMEAKNDLNVIMLNNTITEKRHGLNGLTEHIFQFLNTARYDHSKIYLQECPMAFNDEEPGVWLSAADSIRNPYMGLHHPRYGKAMLDCGENKSAIDYSSKETR